MDRFVYPYGYGNSAILGYTQSMGILSELDIMHGHKNDRQITSSDFDSLISGLKGMTEKLGAVQERISNLLSAFASIEKQLQELQKSCLALHEQVDKLKTTSIKVTKVLQTTKPVMAVAKLPSLSLSLFPRPPTLAAAATKLLARLQMPNPTLFPRPRALVLVARLPLPNLALVSNL